VSGKFRGAAHNDCNINYKFTGRIPVVFHNLRGYGNHVIMQAIGKIQGKSLKCIPNNIEKYISFSLGCMEFIDCSQFMSSSLENLYVGFTILYVSKTLMYDFHYNYIKKKYGPNAQLLFTDTDSLCYNISTENIYEDMMGDKTFI